MFAAQVESPRNCIYNLQEIHHKKTFVLSLVAGVASALFLTLVAAGLLNSLPNIVSMSVGGGLGACALLGVAFSLRGKQAENKTPPVVSTTSTQPLPISPLSLQPETPLLPEVPPRSGPIRELVDEVPLPIRFGSPALTPSKPKKRVLQALIEFIEATNFESFKKIADELIEQKHALSSLTLDSRHNTVLHWIAMKGTPEMLNYLKNKEVGFQDLPGQNGLYVLELAAQFNNHLLIPIFIEWGANPNLSGLDMNTALHIAVLGNYYETVVALINGGCRIDINDGDGYTPLKLAIEKRRENRNNIQRLKREGKEPQHQERVRLIQEKKQRRAILKYFYEKTEDGAKDPILQKSFNGNKSRRRNRNSTRKSPQRPHLPRLPKKPSGWG